MEEEVESQREKENHVGINEGGGREAGVCVSGLDVSVFACVRGLRLFQFFALSLGENLAENAAFSLVNSAARKQGIGAEKFTKFLRRRKRTRM